MTIDSSPRRLARVACAVLAGAVASASAAAQPRPSLLFENVTIIDGTGRIPMTGASVLVEGDRIARIARGALAAPAGATRIDGRGKFLIPGLIDVHVHLEGASQPAEVGIRALHGFLYSGFTTVFDAGNVPDFIYGLRARERAGEIVAPRILATGGVVTAPGGHGSGFGGAQIDSWPAAIPVLDAYLARKPDMVKFTFDEHGWGTRPLIPLLDADVMAKAAQYVNEHGIRTTVHISHEYRARQAIAGGLNTLAHPVIQGPVSESFVKLMSSTHTPIASTLTIGEGYSRLVDHPEFLDQPLYQAVYTSEAITRLKTTVRDEYAKRTWTTWMKVMTPVAQENMRLINAAGGVVALGSDQSSGPASHRELELMVNGGISALDAIRAGTLNAALFLGRDRDYGSIEEGKVADLVLLAADPSVDIRNAAKIDRVFKGGVQVNRAALDLPVNRK